MTAQWKGSDIFMKRTISGMVGKGSLGHNSRSFYADNVDREKSKDNIVFCNEDLKKVYADLFSEALEKYNAKQTRNDRRIEDYYKHIQKGRQEKLFHEVIFQIGNEKDTCVDSKEGALAKEVLSKFMTNFAERNSNLRVFSAHLHMDEATPHLHIDFVPITTGSKRGLETRVSLKKALNEQGFKGGTREATELNQWINAEKEKLAEVMREHGIEWEQLGTKSEHLSVLDYKKKERQNEVKSLVKRVDNLKKQHIELDAIEQIVVSKIPLSGKVTLEKSDYDKLSSCAKKYVVQEKKEGKLKKMLDVSQKEIAQLKTQVKNLMAKLSGFTSIKKHLDIFPLQQENERLRKENGLLRSFMDSHGLKNVFQDMFHREDQMHNEQER